MDTFERSATPPTGVESSCGEEDASSRRESSKSSAEALECERARSLLAEGKYEEAEQAARAAVRALEASDRKALLAGCMTTLGVAQARSGAHEEARDTLLRAVETAEAAGERTCAGRVALALAEELFETMGAQELCEAFERAHTLLAGTRDAELLERLGECARRAVAAAVASARGPLRTGSTPEDRWAGFSLKSEVLRYEAELIESALRDAGGVVSHAARLLGFRHHQTFVALLNNRHKSLLHARNPVVPRRRRASTRAHRAQTH
jgi:tetratricopeptide (TPR) repeat protein